MAKTQLNPDSGYEPRDTDTETIPNPERGCGYLKADNCYLRTDASPGGLLPTFCIFTKPSDDGEKRNPLAPIPFKEAIGQGWTQINGTDLLKALESRYEVTPLSYDLDRATERMVEAGLYDSEEAVPESEVSRHIDRIESDGIPDHVTHYGGMTVGRAPDLLMRAGKSHYEEPWDFIDEAVIHGVNKGIRCTQNSEPPRINSGRTRLWIVHPNACGENKPGIVGFSYLTRVIYTQDTDGEIPEYVREYRDAGRLEEVQAGAPEPREEDLAKAHAEARAADTSLDQFETDSASDSGPEPEVEASGDTSEGTEPVRDVKAVADETDDVTELLVCGRCEENLDAIEDEGLILCESCATVHDPNGEPVPCLKDECPGVAVRYDSGRIHCSGCGRRQKNDHVRLLEASE